MITETISVWKQELFGVCPQNRERDPDFPLRSPRQTFIHFPRPICRLGDTTIMLVYLDALLTSRFR